MELIDTHCHLDIDSFSPRYLELLARAKKAGLVTMVLPGVVHAGWRRLLELCREEKGLYAAPGLHPMYLDHHRPHHLEELKELIRSPKVVALGEIGLDYYIPSLDRAGQQQLFEAQLKIARQEQLPIVLHVRKAHDQVLATLRKTGFSHGGIVHAFNGSYQQAQRYMQFGFGFGIGGTITYDRASRIRRVVSALPLESLVLESDAPDLPPAGHHGEINLPEYLPEIARALATLRNQSLVSIAESTSENARRLLNLPL